MVKKITDGNLVKHIFNQWEETIILSCLQGIMGEIYAENDSKPLSAMAILGDFAFFGGEPNRELLVYKPESCKQDFIIMVPQSEEWGKLIEECYGEKAKKVSRYAIKKEPDVFDREKLRDALAKLPTGFEVKLMDSESFSQCKENRWSGDLVGQFADYEAFEKLGLGAVITKDGEVVCGASSYSRYNGGIEIEIDTKEENRKKGLAYVCAAKLILECLDRNLYPSWDAQNEISVALAEKLGYHFSHTYTAYEIWGY